MGGGAADHQQRWHWLTLVATRWRGGVRLIGGEQAIAGRRGRPGAESASAPGASKEEAGERGRSMWALGRVRVCTAASVTWSVGAACRQ